MEYLQSIIIYLCTVNKVFYRLQSTFLYWLGQAFVRDCMGSVDRYLFARARRTEVMGLDSGLQVQLWNKTQTSYYWLLVEDTAKNSQGF